MSNFAPTSTPRVGSSSKQHPRASGYRARKHHFLLITARKLTDFLQRTGRLETDATAPSRLPCYFFAPIDKEAKTV